MPHYKFSDLAYNITDKKMPEPGDEKTYIGLEHLDSGSLAVTRWGGEIELKGQKLVMKKGDILFGRRNTYLRRAAIAPHDGIFSAHGMIFRPKTEVIDSDYFPFFIASDYFMNAAIKISVGSLSPTVNWKTLKELEFDIPSLEQQRESAKILKAANELKESYQALLLKTDDLVKSQFIEMFGELEQNTKNYPVKKLSDIADYWNGLTYKPADAVEEGSGTLVLRSSNIQNGELAFADNVFVNCAIKDKLFVQDNDILICSRNGSAALVGKTALIKGLKEPTTFGTFMMIIRSQYYPYLKTYFEMPYFRSQISTGTSTINQITGKMLNDIQLPVPDMDAVRVFEEFVHQSDKSKFTGFKSQFIEMFGELGRDDKGWGLTTLGQCCELNPKRPRDINDETMVSFVPMPAVSEYGKIDCSDIRPYKEVRKGFTYFAENDVLFAKITPCMENGKGAVARELENGIGSGSTEFHVLRPIAGKSNPYWLYIITMFDTFRVGAKKVMTGTGGQLRVPIGYLNDYPISLPPIELQNSFEEFVHQSDKSKFELKQAIEGVDLLIKSMVQQELN